MTGKAGVNIGKAVAEANLLLQQSPTGTLSAKLPAQGCLPRPWLSPG